MYFSKQTILNKKEFCVGSDVYSIWCILTFDNQAFFDKVMKTWKCVPQAAYHPPFQVGYHLKITHFRVRFQGYSCLVEANHNLGFERAPDRDHNN